MDCPCENWKTSSLLQSRGNDGTFCRMYCNSAPCSTVATKPCMQKVTVRTSIRKHRDRLAETSEICVAYRLVSSLITSTSSRAWALTGAPTASLVVNTMCSDWQRYGQTLNRGRAMIASEAAQTPLQLQNSGLHIYQQVIVRLPEKYWALTRHDSLVSTPENGHAANFCSRQMIEVQMISHD